MKTTQTYKIGDCLELMKEIPDKSIDLIFFDPPYNIGKDYGVSKDDMQLNDFINFMKSVIYETKRISINGIGLYTYGAKLKFFWDLIPEAEPIIIHTKAVGWKKPPYDIYQYFHSILTTAKSVNRAENVWSNIRVKGEGYFFDEKVIKEHPCQTTLKGTKRFIECFSYVGDIILDPFLGCGTTLLACRETNRNGIGFEINPDYEPIIRKRLMVDVPSLESWV